MTSPIRDRVFTVTESTFSKTSGEEEWRYVAANHVTTEQPRSQGEVTFPTFRNWVIDYIYPSLFGVGLVCNCLSFAVILKSEIRKTSTGVYLCVLAIADCISITSVTSLHWAQPVLGRKLPLFDNRSFKMFVSAFSVSLTAMCVVCLTGDRFIAVWLPFHAKSLASRKRAMIVITIAALSIAAIFSPCLFAMSTNPVTRANIQGYITRGLSIAVNIVCSYGPSVALLFMNAAICVKLALPDKLVKTAATKQTKKTIVTVLAVSFMFIICTVPINVMYSLAAHNIPLTNDLLTLEIVYTIVGVLNLSNHSLNFFLYVVTSASFRRTLIMLVKVLCRFKGRSVKVADLNSFTATEYATSPV